VHDGPSRTRTGMVLLLVAGMLSACEEAPDIGVIEALYADPAERVEIRRLAAYRTFGGVLATVLSANEQASLLLAFREQADPRRMRPGAEISFRWVAGSPERLRGVDVSLNSDETVRLTRDDFGWRSSLIRTPVWVDTIYASGTIENSLWASVVAGGNLDQVPYADRSKLLLQLDKIFQWQVDLVRQLRPGDFYRFAFERQVRPDGTMRTGHILSAELINRARPYYAVWFDPNDDGAGTYYDLEGRSVRRAFLRSPIELRHRISSRFANSRFHPVLKKWRAHRGVDFAAAAGTPVQATGSGRIVKRGLNGSFGNMVEIKHANGFITRYAHLSRFATGVSMGRRVEQGDVIGYVGATGLVTGPNLHYELLINGKARDPMSIELPAGDPVPGDQRALWDARLAERVVLLERMPVPWEIALAVKTRAESLASAPDDQE
jgi:murein DD-endopeptidase MepM/ murein hydrolase activator NlpD